LAALSIPLATKLPASRKWRAEAEHLVTGLLVAGDACRPGVGDPCRPSARDPNPSRRGFRCGGRRGCCGGRRLGSVTDANASRGALGTGASAATAGLSAATGAGRWLVSNTTALGHLCMEWMRMIERSISAWSGATTGRGRYPSIRNRSASRTMRSIDEGAWSTTDLSLAPNCKSERKLAGMVPMPVAFARAFDGPMSDSGQQPDRRRFVISYGVPQHRISSRSDRQLNGMEMDRHTCW